jgi:hypothetical protein
MISETVKGKLTAAPTLQARGEISPHFGSFDVLAFCSHLSYL